MKVSVLLWFCMMVQSSFGQRLQVQPDKPRLNSVFLELSGQARFGAVYYDMVFYRPTRQWHSAIAAGLSFYPYNVVAGQCPLVTIVPMQYNWLHGRETDYLELGIGLNLKYFPEVSFPLFWGGTGTIPTRFEVDLAPRIGYRHQPHHGGFFWKACLVPIVINPLYGVASYNQPIFALASGSLGYTF